VTMRDSTSANSRTAKTVGARRRDWRQPAEPQRNLPYPGNDWTERDDHVIRVNVFCMNKSVLSSGMIGTHQTAAKTAMRLPPTCF
jgi:hypothetical protein